MKEVNHRWEDFDLLFENRWTNGWKNMDYNYWAKSEVLVFLDNRDCKCLKCLIMCLRYYTWAIKRWKLNEQGGF